MNNDIEPTFWTTEKIEKIEKLINENKTASEISRITQIERKRIVRFCKKQNLSLSKGKTILTKEQENIIKFFILQGHTLNEISKLLNLKQRTLSHFCTKNEIYVNVRHNNDYWSEEDIEKLKNFDKEKKGIRDIARLLRKRTKVITEKLFELGLIRELSRKSMINKYLRSLGKRHCWECNTTQLIEDFYLDRKRMPKKCKKCMILKSKLRNDLLNIDNYKNLLFKRLNDSRFRAKTIKKHFNLTLEYLLELYDNQKGLCFYTQKPLIGKINDKMSISIDRIDSSKGYTVDNVVLCGKIINSMKSDMSIDDFFEIIKSINDNHNK